MSEKLKVNLRVGAFLVLICFGASKCYDWAHNNSVGNSSSSESTIGSHTCLQCGKSYSGNGWMTANGEQYQPNTDNGNQYCSKTCAYESQPSKWKR